MSKSLEGTIEHLLQAQTQSSRRLGPLADYLIYLLDRYGLPGAKGGSTGELRVPGLARVKNWDVAYEFAGKFRLLISLKSMLANVKGSVPNRLDDLQGEIANIQQLRPEVVTGYVVLFDVAGDTIRRDTQRPWSEFYESAIRNISIRRSPLWNQGLLEGSWFVRFDSRKPVGQRIVSPRTAARDRTFFVQSLLWELHQREPAVEFTKPPRRPAAVEPTIVTPRR